MLESSIHLLLTGWALITVMMLILWWIHLFTKNAAIVDVGWSLGYVILAVLFAAGGEGFAFRRWLLALLVALWGGRLAFYLLTTRVLAKVPEDPRYTQIRKNWGQAIEFKFFLMFQFQGLLVVLLSIPFLIPSQNTQPSFSFAEGAGVLVWFVAVGGESLADWQLHRFKSNPDHKGQVCRAGLWRYSRHPNYFFEWLTWIAYALYALASPWGWIGVASPLFILFLLLRVSGIPLTEAQALKTKGEAYRHYQRTTSVFVPWFPLQGGKDAR